MRGKIFVLLLLFVFLIVSGCSGKDTGTAAPKDTNTSAPQAGVTEQKGDTAIIPGEVYTVRLRYPASFGITPSTLDIKTGDTVSWWSQKPQKPDYVLVSKENLFSETALDYSVPFNYTFSQPGSYYFSVKDLPDMNITVTVK